MRQSLFAAIAALALSGCVMNSDAAAPSSLAAIQLALSDPARPAADTARDGARKAAKILAFAEVGPGDEVADFIMGGGYFTRLLAGVVGPKGRVYAYQPAEFINFQAKYGDDQRIVASTYANVTPLNQSLQAIAFPERLDAVITVQNYHDLHLAPFPADTATKVNRALFTALKPGGVFVVIDHAAAAGSGLRDSDKLHRIDPAAAKAEIEQAGFRFEAESQILRNVTDPLTANVFDAGIRGNTDQFMYRFRKPRR